MSNIQLSISADSAEDLVQTVAALAASLTVNPTLGGVVAAAAQSGKEATVGVEPAKRGPGRPRKTQETTSSEPQTEPAASPAEVVAARVAAVSAEATAAAAPAQDPTPAPAPEPATASAADAVPPKKVVQDALIEVVKKHGRDACGLLCKAYGGNNLSALTENVYASLLADAKLVLAQNAGEFKAPRQAA